jgi:hypothetical protein
MVEQLDQLITMHEGGVIDRRQLLIEGLPLFVIAAVLWWLRPRDQPET